MSCQGSTLSFLTEIVRLYLVKDQLFPLWLKFVRLYLVKDQLFPFWLRFVRSVPCQGLVLSLFDELRAAPLHLYKTVQFSINHIIGPGYTRPNGLRYTRPSCLAHVPLVLCVLLNLKSGHPSDWPEM